MAEYTAQCRYDGSERIVARKTSASVAFDGYISGGLEMNPYLSAADARTFARGILALADELDGGEAGVKPDTRLRIGDCVRVVRAEEPSGAGRSSTVLESCEPSTSTTATCRT